MKKVGEAKFIKWFSEISAKDTSFVGGKGANLGEMYNSKFPVPPGFVVTAEAYEYFLRETGLKQEIYDILENLDVNETKNLDEASVKIKEMIEKAKDNAEKQGIKNVELLLGEIENLPLKDNSVDTIITNCVINLTPDKAKTFSEAYRVLKPKGKIYLSDIVLLKELTKGQRNKWDVDPAIAGFAFGSMLKCFNLLVYS